MFKVIRGIVRQVLTNYWLTAFGNEKWSQKKKKKQIIGRFDNKNLQYFKDIKFFQRDLAKNCLLVLALTEGGV